MKTETTSIIPIAQYGVVRKSGTLANGVRVVVYEKPFAPISIEFAFQAGAAHEPKEIPGLAHFTEHMIMSGTKRYPKRAELRDVLFDRGINVNAYTGKEIMAVEADCAEESDLAFTFQNIFEMITDSVFDPDTIEKERGAILQEIKMKEANRSAMHGTLADSHLYQKTRIERYVLGGEKSVSRITRDELVRYSKEMFVPERMVVIVAGGTTFDIVARELVAYPAQAQTGKPFVKTEELAVVREKALMIHLVEGDEEVKVTFGFRVGNMFENDKYAFCVAEDILLSGSKSRLYYRLRGEEGLVYGVGGGVDTIIDGGNFCIETSCSRKNLQRVLDIICEELMKIRDQGVTHEEVLKHREAARKREKFAKQTASEWLSSYNDVFCFEKNETILDRRAKYDAVTPEDVQSAFKKYCTKDTWYLALTGDIKEGDVKVNFT